ncbi:hypothetical protein, partial [Kitasatospora aureofaciens]
GGSLLRLEWVPAPSRTGAAVRSVWVESPAELDAEVPEAVVVSVPTGRVPEVVHEVTAWALGLVREWLAEERFGGSRLVFV